MRHGEDGLSDWTKCWPPRWMIVILPSTQGRSPRRIWATAGHTRLTSILNWEMNYEILPYFGIIIRSWYIWNYKSAEGVGLESKVEPQVAKWRSCHQVGRPKQAGAKPVQVSKAPQYVQAQMEYTEQEMELICYLNEMLIQWNYYWMDMNWIEVKVEIELQSQAKPSWPEMKLKYIWNIDCISCPRSRSMGPSVLNWYCFLWTFPIPTDDSCLLSTRDRGTIAPNFWTIKLKEKFGWS